MIIKISEFIGSICAVSITDANKIVKLDQKNTPIVLDFSAIKAVSSPFLRTLLTGFQCNVDIQNGNSIIRSKWQQIQKEKNSTFDIYEEIEHLRAS